MISGPECLKRVTTDAAVIKKSEQDLEWKKKQVQKAIETGEKLDTA